MKARELKDAIAEADRFIKAAEALIDEINDPEGPHGDNGWGVLTGTARSGSCRRASLDLTRALARLRRSR